MRHATARDLLLLGLGIVIGMLATLAWPRSTFEECMLGKIHDPALLTAAYRYCKDMSPKGSKG